MTPPQTAPYYDELPTDTTSSENSLPAKLLREKNNSILDAYNRLTIEGMFNAYISSITSYLEPTKREYWEETLEKCTNLMEILSLFRLFGHDKTADRIRTLQTLTQEEDDVLDISFKSLKNLTRFVMSEGYLGEPRIGVSQDGNLQAEWRFGKEKYLSVNFLTNGNIDFFSINKHLSNENQGSGRLSGNNTLPSCSIRDTLKPILFFNS